MLPFAPDIYNLPLGDNSLNINPPQTNFGQASASFAGINTGTFQRYWWLIAIAAGVIGFFIGRGGGRFKI